jgi:hypothetical protein
MINGQDQLIWFHFYLDLVPKSAWLGSRFIVDKTCYGLRQAFKTNSANRNTFTGKAFSHPSISMRHNQPIQRGLNK